MTSSAKHLPQFAFAAPEVPVAPGDGSAWLAVLRLLRRRVRLIGVLSAAICLAALPSILALPRVYYAETRVLVAPTPTLALTDDPQAHDDSFDVDTEIQRLASEEVVDAVIARFDLAGREEFNSSLRPQTRFGALREKLRDMFDRAAGHGAPATSAETVDERVAQAFRSALSLAPGGEVDMIVVGFQSEDPTLAAAVPGAMVDTYVARRDALWQQEVAAAHTWVERRITAARDHVTASRAALEALIGRAGVERGQTLDTVTLQLTQTEERISELEGERFDLAATRRSVAAALADPEIPAADEPSQLEAMRGELRAETRKLEKFAQVYGDRHEAVAQSRERIAALKAEIASELTAYDRRLAIRDAALATERDQLSARAETARSALAALSATAPLVERQTETLRAQEAALSQLEYRRDAVLARGELSPVALEVISPARVPLDPLGPGRKLYLLGTGFGALVFATMIAAILELRDTGVRGHEQLADLKTLVPVGLWPALTKAQRSAMPGDLSKRLTSPPAEALRDTLLMMETANGGRLPRQLTVVAPRAEDMVEPVADWIARELSARGARVQLVKTPPPPEPPAERKGRNAAALRTLSDLATEPDGVTIVQAPPLMCPGALRFASADGPVLLVLRWGRTPRAMVELCAGLLSKLRAGPVYTLIAGAKPRRHRLYGFTDRLSLARGSRPGTGPLVLEPASTGARPPQERSPAERKPGRWRA